MRRFLLASIAVLVMIVSLSPALTQETQAANKASWVSKRMAVTINFEYGGSDYCVATDGLQVYTWYCQRDSSGRALTSQQWQLVPRSNTTQANIRWANTTKCVSANPTTGALSLVTCSTSTVEQCWDIYDMSAEYWGLTQPINPCNNLGKSIRPVPDVFGYPNGVPIKVLPDVAPRVKWSIDGEGGQVRIRSAWNNKCLTLESKYNVVLSRCAIDARQLFVLDQGKEGVRIGTDIGTDGLADHYLCSGLFIQNGARPYNCYSDGLGRDFEFRAVGAYFQIQDVNGKCLDVNNVYAPEEDGIPVQFWDCLGTNSRNQLWYIESYVES